MKTFKQFINESKYPFWVRTLSVMLSFKIKSLSTEIENENDVTKQNILIGKQNTLNGYLNMLELGIETNDMKLLNRVKSMKI